VTVADRLRPQITSAEPTAVPGAELRAAIVRAVGYADVFDAPLERSRVHLALDRRASPNEVRWALESPGWADGILEIGEADLTISGRGGLCASATARRAVSARRWPAARVAGRLIGALPFIRMVAVSGSLAVDSSDGDADIDLFVVTADGRLWVARRLIMGLVRLFALARIRLCPNYLLALSALELEDRTLFVAHELAQLVPVAGHGLLPVLIERNRWAAAELPNAFDIPTSPSLSAVHDDGTPGRARTTAERLLRSRLFDRLERWELARIRRRHPDTGAGTREARFDERRCKGHLVPNGRRTLEAYAARLAALGEDA
jgi:hypothetical protein